MKPIKTFQLGEETLSIEDGVAREEIKKLSGFEPVVDPSTGVITGYKTTAGGDTIFPLQKLYSDSGEHTDGAMTQKAVADAIQPLSEKMESFENTKSEIASSGLGSALGLAISNTWAQIVNTIKGIKNKGDLNYSPNSNTSMSVEPGYYTGGTISTKNAYNSGLNVGKSYRYVEKLTQVYHHNTRSSSNGQDYDVTVPANNGSVFIIVTSSTHGNSNADQVSQTATTTNGTIEQLFEVNSNPHTYLWKLTKSSSSSASTVTFKINRTLANISVVVLKLSDIKDNKLVTGLSGIAATSPYSYNYVDVNMLQGRVYFILTKGQHGNTSDTTTMHSFMGEDIQTELLFSMPSTLVTVQCWCVIRSSSSSDDLRLKCGRSALGVEVYQILIE